MPEKASKGTTVSAVVTVLSLLLIVSAFIFIYGSTFMQRILLPTNIDPHDVSQINHRESVNRIVSETFARNAALRPPIAAIPQKTEQMRFEMLYDILSRWNPDDPDEPADFKETLQHFDFGDERERNIALSYRQKEIPFKMYNISEFIDTARKWSDEYLLQAVPSNYYRTVVERSDTNHFMFWTRKGLRRNTPFEEPTKHVHMTFAEWLHRAKDADAKRLSNATDHYYFQTNAEAHERGRSFISRDLPLFSSEQDNFFVHKVKANKGIQCRFGMRGIIAEAHYDSGRNMVAMLRGKKRYILTPPWTCNKLAIIGDNTHPSYRHSVIDWSDLSQAKSRGFDSTPAIDTIVRMGEVLYIPSFWFHYIISMEYSIQCNSRSGFPDGKLGKDHINSCFRKKKRDKKIAS